MAYSLGFLGFANDGGAASSERALAAIFGQERNEAIHRLEARGIDHRAALAAHGDKSCRTKPVEMKSERVGRKPQGLRDVARGHAVRPGLHQSAEDFQPVFLGKRGEGGDGICRFHISTNIEIMTGCQEASEKLNGSAASIFGMIYKYAHAPAGLIQ